MFNSTINSAIKSVFKTCFKSIYKGMIIHISNFIKKGDLTTLMKVLQEVLLKEYKKYFYLCDNEYS